MNIVIKYLRIFFSIPKSFLFNLKFFPFVKAIRLPIWLDVNTSIGKTSGKIELSTLKTGMVKIGFGGSYALGNKSYVSVEGRIQFNGKASFARGTQIIVGKEGQIVFGEDFRSNANCIFNSNKLVSFGNDCLLAWNVTCLDSDGHIIVDGTNNQTNLPRKISVGNHVWICPNVTLLKGTEVQNNNVIATGTIINKKICISNSIIGSAGEVLKNGIDWNN